MFAAAITIPSAAVASSVAAETCNGDDDGFPRVETEFVFELQDDWNFAADDRKPRDRRPLKAETATELRFSERTPSLYGDSFAKITDTSRLALGLGAELRSDCARIGAACRLGAHSPEGRWHNGY